MYDHSLTDPQVDSRNTALRCVLVALASCGIVAATFFPALGGTSFDGLVGMLVLTVAALLLLIQSRLSHLAAWLVVIGGIATAGIAWSWYPWWGMAGVLVLPVIVGAAILGWSGSLLATLAATGLLIGVSSGTLPISADKSALLASAALIWASFVAMALMVWQQNVTVSSALRGYEKARHSLTEAQNRQLELNQVLKDLDLAHRELIRLNDLLKAAREAVEETRRAKEEFVANVSHELRTPLNMVIGFSDEILERPGVYDQDLPVELLEDIAVIKRNSEQLARLVDDVLDLVEADTGFTRLIRERTLVDEIVRSAADAVRPFFERKMLTLTVDAEPGLPRLNCDPTRIRQVVLNLLSNAARFTEHGGAEVRVSRDCDDIVITVTDTGPGMDPAIVGRMFEPFQQADPSLRRRYGGTGLGLAISKRLVELHGGDIWIESQCGVGTKVGFSLSAKKTEAVRAPAAARWFSPYHDYSYQIRSEPSAANTADSEPSIAVVEKSTSLARLLWHYLAGWEVASFPSLDAAARAFGTSGFSAIVVNDPTFDHRSESKSVLPLMDIDIPVIHCWVPSVDDVAARMGVAEYLVKPVTREALIRSIESASPGAGRVLIVDDDQDAHLLFGKMLDSAGRGYQVAHASNGAEALETLKAWQPDVVLLDLLMPTLDGQSVLAARAADAELRRVPVVIVSAMDQRQDPFMSSGLTCIRQRGLSARDLVTAIEALATALPPRFGSLAQHENPAP